MRGILSKKANCTNPLGHNNKTGAYKFTYTPGEYICVESFIRSITYGTVGTIRYINRTGGLVIQNINGSIGMKTQNTIFPSSIKQTTQEVEITYSKEISAMCRANNLSWINKEIIL